MGLLRWLGFSLLIWSSLLPAQAWTVRQLRGRDFVPLTEVAEFYGYNRVRISPLQVSLVKPGQILVGKPGNRDFSMNNVRFFLSQPLVADEGTVFISRVDLAKTLDPVLRPSLIQSPPVKTIILDPGHGGNDQGTWSFYGTEKAYALDLALRVRTLLSEKGIPAVLTRSTDTYVALDDRVRMAALYPNGVFVSLHFNSGRAQGVETYCLAPQGVPSTDQSLTLADRLAHAGNDWDAENIALATSIHGTIIRQLKVLDRGVRRARFHVLRDAPIPAVLIEGGYLGGGDAYSIATGAYRRALAKAIADGLLRYLRAVPAPEPPPLLVRTETLPKPPLSTQSAPSKSEP